jgi:predicted branched-subunit amino acid permease
MLPLWFGAIPSGLAFGVAADHAGLSPAEAQLMSLTMFSAAAQMGGIALLGAAAPAGLLLATVLALNAQTLLLGIGVGRQIPLSPARRALVAWFLTDGAYGVASARGPLTLPGLVGAGVSMYLAWNLGTALGSFAGTFPVDPRRFGLNLVVPLAFLAVLVPLLRTRATRVTAVTATLGILLLSGRLPVGLAVLGAGSMGIAAGAWMDHRRGPSSRRGSPDP